MELAAESSKKVWPLGRFLVLAKVGSGGMAEVFLALARGPNGFNKLVVLKLLRSHLAEDNEFVQMFMNEARLAALLNHPHVVSTYEVTQEGAQQCIVMEYLEGQSLAAVEHAARKKGMPLALSLRILADSLAALKYAHELTDHDGRSLSIVHRDVSPQNIVVTYDGVVKLLDFGIAKAANSAACTRTGTLKGKVRYMAPERLTGEDADCRSDLFAVGVMMWQALTGAKLWDGLNDVAVIQNLCTSVPIPNPRSICADVHPTLDAICVKALAYDPAARFQTAEEFQDAIEDFMTSQGLVVTARAFSKFMGECFGGVRAEFQLALDEQLRVAATLPPDSVFESMSRLRVAPIPLLSPPTPRSIGPMCVSSPGSEPSGIVASQTLGSAAPLVQRASSRPPKRRADGGVSRIGVGVLLASLVFTGSALFSFRGARDEANVVPAVAPPSSVDIALRAPDPPTNASAPAPLPAAEASASASSSPPTARGLPPSPAPATARAVRPAAAVLRAPAPLRGPDSPRLLESSHGPGARNSEMHHDVDCSSPYYLDGDNVKKIRAECL